MRTLLVTLCLLPVFTFAGKGFPHFDCNQNDLTEFQKNSLILANKYFQRNDVSRSISYLKRGIRKDPDFYMGYVYLGYLYSSVRDVYKANKYLSVAIDKRPNRGEAHYHMGNLLLLQEKYKEALLSFEEGIVQDPNFHYGYNALYRFRKTTSAQEKTLEARLLNRMNELGLTAGQRDFNHGLLLLSQGNYDTAFELFGKAENTEEVCAGAGHFHAGLSMFYARDFEPALESFKKAIGHEYRTSKSQRFIKLLTALVRSEEVKASKG